MKEEETDVFVLVEERRSGPQEVIAADDDDEMESAMASAAQQREQEMQVCMLMSVEGGSRQEVSFTWSIATVLVPVWIGETLKDD